MVKGLKLDRYGCGGEKSCGNGSVSVLFNDVTLNIKNVRHTRGQINK